MDYTTILKALQAKAEAETAKTEELQRKKPRKYANCKDRGAFWRSLAEQLEKYLVSPNGHMPFSDKQAFYVSKAIVSGRDFWAFWKQERRLLGLWDRHEPRCKCERGLRLDGDDLVICRDCSAVLGRFVPDEVDARECVYKTTQPELPETIDFDEIDFFEGATL